MKMVAVNFEIVRATSAVAEFLVHVELDGPVEEYAVTGHSVGPQCPVASTIEVSYPLTEMERGETRVSLRCVIPEPNLWTQETPFTYAVRVDLKARGVVMDSRSGVVALRSR
jgi:beta-galactosidase/beta-glucuronidase